jgi:hypothetical protein
MRMKADLPWQATSSRHHCCMPIEWNSEIRGHGEMALEQIGSLAREPCVQARTVGR